MRLIDADFLMNRFNEFFNGNVKDMSEDCIGFYNNLAILLNKTPTAYDINDVIVQLSDDIEPNVDIDTGFPLDDNYVLDIQNELTANHILIVSSGLNYSSVIL